MSQVSIRKALEQRLAIMTPELATAWENAPFLPVTGAPYQKAFLLPGQPDNSEQGSKNYFEVGVFQVTLCYPLGTGPNAAQARAEAIRTQFRRGTTMTADGISVHVIRTPAIATGYTDGDRYMVPVSITWQAHISL